VPNGNGTSTVIRSDGRIETIPTPKWQLYEVSWASRWTIVYFVWLRERTGATQEELPLPDDVETIADLVNYLSRRDARHAAAFGSPLKIRCAVNHEFADLSSPIQPGGKVAFSSPVTGG
jgi:molybdopterin synthase sulfur carrier subunit